MGKSKKKSNGGSQGCDSQDLGQTQAWETGNLIPQREGKSTVNFFGACVTGCPTGLSWRGSKQKYRKNAEKKRLDYFYRPEEKHLDKPHATLEDHCRDERAGQVNPSPHSHHVKEREKIGKMVCSTERVR